MDAKVFPSAGEISARIDRLPATATVWRAILLLSAGMFFELYDLLFSGYIAPGLVKSGVLTQTTAGLFGTTGVASFIAALFSGLFVGTLACVPCSLSCRVARVDEVDKLHSLDHAARVHIAASDDALRDHRCTARKLRRIFNPVSPDFSG